MYPTLLQLEAFNDVETLTKEEWIKLLNQTDLTSVDKNYLQDFYDDGIELSARWIFECKDKLMHKISSIFPDLTFDLYGDGEDHGDEWSETWKNGRRVKFINDHQMARFMMKNLKIEHPEIYQKYISMWYESRKKIVYDDKQIIIGSPEDKSNINTQILSITPTIQNVKPVMLDPYLLN